MFFVTLVAVEGLHLNTALRLLGDATLRFVGASITMLIGGSGALVPALTMLDGDDSSPCSSLAVTTNHVLVPSVVTLVCKLVPQLWRGVLSVIVKSATLSR